VLVLAQEEARHLHHGFIGTEHLLLGLISEGEGVAARALEELDVHLDDVRRKVEELIGPSAEPTGSPPFTPRAKKVLELSLREALQLHHNYIGTEHVLLGLVREGEGVAAQALVDLGVDLVSVRQTVIELIDDQSDDPSTGGIEEDPRASMVRASSSGRNAGLVACSFCGRRPPRSGRLVEGRAAFICEHCIRDWGNRFVRGDVDEADDPVARLYESDDDGGDQEGTTSPRA
jgi:ATP-dependent Clp protease ATP-binding subunit ClpC